MLYLLFADGDTSARQASRIGFAAVAGVVVAGEAGTFGELLARLAGAVPGVVLLDPNLPGSNAFALLPALREHPSYGCWPRPS